MEMPLEEVSLEDEQMVLQDLTQLVQGVINKEEEFNKQLMKETMLEEKLMKKLER
ncbi:MAG: hypothetical protein VW270_27670 [Candidatus Poseidoniales archaeon]